MSKALEETPVTQFPVAPPFDQGASAGNVADYRGQPADEAKKALLRKGFQVTLDDRYSGDLPPGRVVGSDPAAGQRVAAGGTVTLFVATTQGRPGGYAVANGTVASALSDSTGQVSTGPCTR